MYPYEIIVDFIIDIRLVYTTSLPPVSLYTHYTTSHDSQCMRNKINNLIISGSLLKFGYTIIITFVALLRKKCGLITATSNKKEKKKKPEIVKIKISCFRLNFSCDFTLKKEIRVGNY